ncbi:MAG: aminoacyl-tRNA hydrolase [Phototrophicales bacterium]|nr:MAG: aminoacyl-tRNA hydrolase [Phototrophicales bacterium]
MTRYLVVGLGNPGVRYEKTRHNIGFWVVDELARRWNASNFKTERKALVADATIKNQRVLLIKPQTYMNLSGEAVRAIIDFYKLDIENLIVIHDDLDVDFGVLRIRKGGSAGGQNGVKNIIQHLHTQNFKRIRCGIGRPPGRMDPADYVLEPFKGDQEITARLMVDRAADAVETWLSDGIDIAMNRYNGAVEKETS